MEAFPFENALEALQRPLEFAAADDFARIGRVANLEKTVQQAAGRLAALAVPGDVRKAAKRIEGLFADAAMDDAGRRRAVQAAQKALAPLGAPDYADQALARSVKKLPGIGERRAQELERRGLGRVIDLLFHLPVRYEDRRRLQKIAELEVGRHAIFAGEVLTAGAASRLRRGRRPLNMFHAVLDDGSGRINLKWFQAGEQLAKQVHKGARLVVAGEVSRYRFDKEVVHPEIDSLADGETPQGTGLVPVYTTPQGLPPRTFRNWVDAALEHYTDLVWGALPEELVRELQLPSPAESLRCIHRPGPDADIEALMQRDTKFNQRLVLEELFLLEVGIMRRRAGRERQAGIALNAPDTALEPVIAGLPFRLTNAQRRAFGEIRRDLARPHPMSRLLQGDVGSGKTVVAALAAATAAKAGFQGALMAPTELLAEQHQRTLHALLGKGSGLRMVLLTSSTPKADAVRIRRWLALGRIDFVIGTHALVQGDVQFARLALAVIDEQHRFGVLQRQALSAKAPEKCVPHTLVMTATPIPRSLALTLYGDLELSVIDEMPPGRRPVKTLLMRAGEGPRVFELLEQTLARGEQAYVVYPLVEESEKLDLRAAAEQAERITRALPQYRVDLLHGRLGAAERGEVMARFARGETRVLVATTVIEVGVDIADATLMIVEHAERFGLAQLHQLRGRVGRGEKPGTCVMVARGGGEDSEARLRAMLETHDGFKIADADLKIRGHGDFIGTRQSGKMPDLRFADLTRDLRLLKIAQDAAREVVADDPALRRRPRLARAVQTHWGGRIALADVG